MSTPTRQQPAAHAQGRLAALRSKLRTAAAGPWAVRVAVGAALLVAAVALVIAIERSETRADQAEGTTVAVTAQRDEVAQDLQEDATTISALCATGGEVARALDTAGQCGRAAERLNNPVVVAQDPTLTPEQINAIVARVLALSPPPQSIDEVVGAVLARMGTDPTLRGLTADDVRAIVATAIAALPEPRDGADGQDGQDGNDGADGDDGLPGTSFGGLAFTRQGGRCVAVVTFVDPDGSTRTEALPVGDGACEPPPPEPTVDPPAPTTEPPPPTSDPPPVTTEPPVTQPPATTPAGPLDGLLPAG